MRPDEFKYYYYIIILFRSTSRSSTARFDLEKEDKLDKIEERSEREETMSVEHAQVEFKRSITPKDKMTEIDRLIQEIEDTIV